jgi:hypothetical protein
MFSKLLSKQDNDTYKLWSEKKDKPLFIMGYDGCGKTYWANELLKRYHIILVGSDFIKYSKDIKEYLNSSLLKKDIFMMMKEGNQYKALLVDDIQLFSQNDKTNLNHIHKFVQKLDYQKTPVIYVCNETTDKCIKSMKLQSYVITIKFNLLHYKQILKQNNISESLLRKSKNLNTLLSTNLFNDILLDTVNTIEYTMKDILVNNYSCQDVIRLCSSDYSILSLNLIENIPYVTNKVDPKIIHTIYQMICLDDYIEYKYLQHNLDMDIRIFYSVVYPLYYVKQTNPIVKEIKYNRYISRSMIQIHNQTIVKDKSEIYLSVIKLMYQTIISLTNNNLQEVKDRIDYYNLDIKVLEKQIKVFNYYYNKLVTKKQFTKLIKQIIS